MTWYDADDLLVLDGAGDQTSLWEVPVDGQPATPLPGVLPGAISITANSARNALVVGMTQNRMEVSAGLVGALAAARQRRPEPGVPGPRHPRHPPALTLSAPSSVLAPGGPVNVMQSLCDDL